MLEDRVSFTWTTMLVLKKSPAVPCIASTSATIRDISSSTYGRAHVFKRRPAKLPSPVIPQFPQTVVRADGSTFTQWTTSPRHIIKLTRDLTNAPLWNSGGRSGSADGLDEEISGTGRLGRFNRRFEGVGAMGGVDWGEEMTSVPKKDV